MPTNSEEKYSMLLNAHAIYVYNQGQRIHFRILKTYTYDTVGTRPTSYTKKQPICVSTRLTVWKTNFVTVSAVTSFLAS